jgi:hypothetical protein
MRFLRRLRYWFDQRARAEELAEELAFQMKRRELVESGPCFGHG